MKKYFLIYLDILGFDKLAKEVERNCKVESRKVRKDFINIIERKIEGLKNQSLISNYNYGKRDDWILVVNNIQNVFLSISRILDHNTSYKGKYKRIPLEIAIGTSKYDRWANLEEGLIYEDNTISFLKSKVIPDYKKWFKKTYHKSTTNTYIILTDSFYLELSEHYKKQCRKIIHKRRCIFKLPLSIIAREKEIIDFLYLIGQSRNDLSGALIDRVFVPPDEYDTIKETLEKDSIVLITGPPGYGKTYTAIRLLWEYYKRGYIPRWISGKEEDERKILRDRLANIKNLLIGNHVFYFEDPFGKTKYERREDLKERINYIKSALRNKEEAYVIITSRKDVFEKFKEESYSVGDLKKLEQELNIIKPSYNYEKRKEILEKWGEEKDCKWLRNKKLRESVFKSLKEKSILPTPLSIHNFSEATKSTTKEIELMQNIDLYSEEDEKAFADEIIGLYESNNKDRVLFLFFIFISEYFEIDSLRQVYSMFKEDDFEDFQKILKLEYRVKIECNLFNKKIIKFSHPSYSNALKYILNHPGCRNNYVSLIKKLIINDTAIEEISETLIKNFCIMPKELQDLLFKLTDKENAAREITFELFWYFDELPENSRNELIKRMATKKEPPGKIGRLIIHYYNDLPTDIKDLIFKLKDKKYVSAELASAIVADFNNLPKETQDFLFELIEYGSTHYEVTSGIVKNYNNLPKKVKNLLFEFSKDEILAGGIALSIIYNYIELPNEVQDMLPKLIPRASLYTKIEIPGAIVSHYNKLPEKAQKLLFELINRNIFYEGTISEIVKGYKKLPKKVQNLIFQMAKKDYSAGMVTKVIADDFNDLPVDVREELLSILSNKKTVKKEVAQILKENFDDISYKVRNNLLLNLLNDEDIFHIVRDLIKERLEELSDNVRKKFIELQNS